MQNTDPPSLEPSTISAAPPGAASKLIKNDKDETIDLDLQDPETEMEHTADGGMATFVHWSKIVARR